MSDMDTGTPEGGPRADLLPGSISANSTKYSEARQRYPQDAGHKDTGGPGEDAARGFGPKLCYRRAETLAVYDKLPTATPDEVAAVIGREPLVVRPRVTELCKLGELTKTGERRRSAYGATQTVYRRTSSEERALFLARAAAEVEKYGGDH